VGRPARDRTSYIVDTPGENPLYDTHPQSATPIVAALAI
jgi:hypothetical protein